VQPLLQWKRNKYYIFLVYVCSLRYPAYNAGAPCCHMWPARLYNIFPYYLVKGTILEREKKVIEHKMCVLISSINFSETFLILRTADRDIDFNQICNFSTDL
jgi:hypothetical protein